MGKIHRAARKGDTASVASLLDAGADIEAREKVTGATPLHLAATNSHVELMRFLISRGADRHAQASFGTPLHWAGTPEAGEVLLASGVEIDVRSNSGATPLHEAAKGGNAAMVAFFIEKGADVDARTDKGKTPLDCAFGSEAKGLLEAVGGTRKEPSKLEAWAETDPSDNLLARTLEGRSATQRAVKLDNKIRKGDVESVRTLLDQGYTSPHGLWYALVGKTDAPVIVDADVVSLVLAGSRMSPAHSRIAQMLIEAGADANAPTEHGLTTEGRAKRWASFPPTAIRATFTGSVGLIGLLTAPADDAPVIDKCEVGLTPLHMAVMNNDADVVRALLAQGADPNPRSSDDETPLHLAVLYASPEAAAVLVAAGADVNARTAELAETPLAWASRWLGTAVLPASARQQVEAIAMLLREHGAVE